MSVTKSKRPVTKDEVLEAVEKSSVLDVSVFGGRTVSDLSATSVAEVVAGQRGERVEGHQYRSRSSLLRSETSVSLSQVKRHLRDLVEEGAILAVRGDHFALRTCPGVLGAGTYYLSHEARDLACEAEDLRVRDAVSSAAEKWATKVLVETHEEEHRRLRVQFVAEHPSTSASDRW